jgi:glycosyltransferase involved in cell wall biosynthesis
MMTAGSPRKRLCVVPRLEGVGGTATFQQKFVGRLETRGFDITFDLRDPPFDGVLVVGGTRNLRDLGEVKRQGIPIVQRLDGINWIHRRRWTGPMHFLRAERGNWLLSRIRSRLADRIVYQSDFVWHWWEREFGETPVPYRIIHNGIDLAAYSPLGPGCPPPDRWRMLVVEGRLGGGYEIGIEHALQLAGRLKRRGEWDLELAIVGMAADHLRKAYQTKSTVDILWFGAVPREDIPEINRSSHFLFSADIHAACPNSVIEAMACGCPVVAFDTGALTELVRGDAGLIVPYGGNAWALDPPDFESLADAAEAILREQDRFRQGARAHAEEALDLDVMVDRYLEVFGWR